MKEKKNELDEKKSEDKRGKGCKISRGSRMRSEGMRGRNRKEISELVEEKEKQREK